MCYFYYYIYFLFFFYNLNLSFAQPRMPFILFVYAAFCLRILNFAFGDLTHRQFTSVAYFRGLALGMCL